MSPRDRACMVLAYLSVRADGRSEYVAELLKRFGGSVSQSVGEAYWRARMIGAVEPGLGRVRLALLLRVLLRADAGDFGPVECTGCGDGGWRFDRAGQRCSGCDIEHWQDTRELDSEARYERVRFTPLWETAPAHRGER